MPRLAALPIALVALCACTPSEPLELGDGLLYVGTSATPSFWESTDVEVLRDVAYICTGVRSLTVHDFNDDPSTIEWERSVLFPESHGSYPRCSHVTSDGDDRLVVTSHRDEVQRTPWVALLDVDRKDDPVVLDSWSTEDPIEEAAIVGGAAYVTAHDDGLLKFDISGGDLDLVDQRGALGNAARIAPFGDDVIVGNVEGDVFRITPDLQSVAQVGVGAPVQALLQVGPDRAAVALGSAGLALVDFTLGEVLHRVDTRGTALRLDSLGETDLLLTNWADLRVYTVEGDELVLRAVDAVPQAGDRPRHLAAGSEGDVVVAGEWSGVHTLRYTPGVDAPELSTDSLLVKLPADGEPQSGPLTLRNEGRLPLEVTGMSLPDGWSAEPDELQLEPGAEAVITVRHVGFDSPTSGVLEIASNDFDEQPATVGLQLGSARVTVGDEAPDFTSTGINTGESHTLSEQRGRVVLLSYFGVF